MNIKTLILNSNLTIDKNNILFDEPMSKHSTFKIGGPAECFVKIETRKDLIEILDFAKKNKIDITILGNGSNILVLDGGIKGITISIKLENVQIQENKDNVYVTAEAGCKIGKLAQVLLKNEITGFEELSGIPGTMGGAIKMNAGAHGKEMKDVVEEVTVIDYDGNEKILKNESLGFGYRTSIFKKEKYIITSVKFNLKKGNKEEIKAKMDQYSKYRIEKQPIEYPSAGSTFKRGADFITAKLIEDAGLKGYRVGDAEISTKHSGFVINKGNATAKDVLELVKYIEEKIESKYGKKLELEVEIFGQENK